MTKEFVENLDYWHFKDHSFFFHNEEAVDRLLNRHWPEFPELQQAMKCLRSGAAKADLWRALVLWEYGGIYTDIDNKPNTFNETTITDDDDAYFVVEQIGLLSQYFFAAAPRHPLMYMLVRRTIHRLLSVNSMDTYYIPRVTGPGALKDAFIYFMHDQGPNTFHPPKKPHVSRFDTGKVVVGLYTGMANWTVRVEGTAKNSNAIVERGIIRRKDKLYKKMNMTHFSRTVSVKATLINTRTLV